MAKFKVVSTFKITSRGFIIAGDILDGEIAVGDYIHLNSEFSNYHFKILGVEMVDKIHEKVAHVGLMISFSDMEKIKDFKLVDKELDIHKAS